jgi:hypothetical protein
LIEEFVGFPLTDIGSMWQSLVQYIYPTWDMNEYILFHEIKQAKNMPTFLCCYLAMYWRKLIFDCFISFREVLTERI